MAEWIRVDTKLRSHWGKSLALSLLIAGVWPMAAMAEKVSTAITETTDLYEPFDADLAPSEKPNPTQIGPERTTAYISPIRDLQLTLETTETATDHLLAPLPTPEALTDNPQSEFSIAAQSRPAPHTSKNRTVTDLLSQTSEVINPLADSPSRTLAEAGWTSEIQVVSPQSTSLTTSAEATAQPLAQAKLNAPLSQTSETAPQLPAKTEISETTSESLGIPYFVDAEFRGSTRRQFGVLNLRLPVFQNEKSLVFADIHFEAGSNETFLGNLGFAYRRVLNSSEENPWILGAHAFYDTTRSENGFQYHQGSLGTELVGKKFEFRVNGYLPGNNSNVVGQRTVNGVLGLQTRANGLGTNIVQQTLTLEARERALAGFNFEVGHHHHFSNKVSLGLFGGYFFFDSSATESIDGPMARAQIEVQDPLGMNGGLLQVGGRFRFDEIRDSELEGFIRLSVPFGGPRHSQPLTFTQRLARRPIEREYEITTFAQDINHPLTLTELQAAAAGLETLSVLGPQLIASTFQVVLNPATGQPITVFFIDGDDSPGNGTQGNPLTVAQISALTQPNDILFFLNNAGTIDTQTGPGNTLALLEGQQVLGVGTTPNFVLTFPTLGSLTIFDAGQPQLVNGANNNILTLANNNTIDGLAFNGQNSAPRGISGITGATNTTIRNSSFGNFTVAGIQITPSTNTTIDNIVFNNNNTDVIVNAANTTLTNIVSTNATGPALQILNATGTTTLTNIDISNSGGDGLQFANPSGTITATNVDITNADDNGLEITGGDGTFTFDTTSSITNATNAAFNVVGGTTTIIFNGTITQNNPASAINITDKTGGTTTFNGLVTANTSTAIGINLTNSSTVSFTGGLDVDTTTAVGFNATGSTVNVGAVGSTGTYTITTTDGLAVNIADSIVDTTFDAINATRSTSGSGITLNNLDGAFAVNGGTLSSPVGDNQNSFSIIQNDATATRNLTVAIDGISIIHDATASIGSLDFGVFAETHDDDKLALSIANSTFKTEDQGVVAQGITEGLTITNFSNNTLQGDATAFNPAFFANGFRFDGVVFDADPNTAGLQEVQGGILTLGSSTERTSFGFIASRLNSFRSSIGTIRFDQFNANVTNAAILTDASSADLTIRILDGNVDAGRIDLNQVDSDINLSSLTLADSTGLRANQVTGAFTVTGATSITAPELSLVFGTQFFSPSQTTQGINITNSSANFAFNSISIAPSTVTPATNSVLTNGGPTVGIQLIGNTGTFTATGTTTINTTVEDGILISNNSGNVTFGATNVSNPGAPIVTTPLLAPRVIDAAGIDIEGVNTGVITFGNTNITNLGDDTGVDFAGSDPDGGVTFSSLNITGTGTVGSVGIDLSSTQNNRLIQIGDIANPATDSPSSIANVEIGVELSSSMTVGTTANANFIFGDGEDTIDQASTISVIVGGVTIQDLGLDPASGTYNFDDVTNTGNPNF